MAIVWRAFRDLSEATVPPTVQGVAPIEGGMLVRHDDIADTVNHCAYILLRRTIAGNGSYSEQWRVLSPDKSAVDAGPFTVAETVNTNTTELILLPPKTAVSSAHRSYNLGNKANPLASELIALVSGWDVNTRNRFGRVITRAVYNSDVAGSYIQANF